MRNSRYAVRVSVLLAVLMIYSGLCCNLNTAASESNGFEPVFQKGMSYRHYPFPYDSSFSNESLERMAEANTEYVAITVWWLQENLSTTRIYRKPDWTATDTSLAIAIARAHELGMKVMLKPMVDPEDAYTYFRGAIPSSPEWFENYEAFIASYAKFAKENNVDLLCIGCEFKGTEHDEISWRRIIDRVKEHYAGPLTYAATFDSFQSITWWDSLDYVGIDAYFPLTNKNDPSSSDLRQAWNRIADAIEYWALAIRKPIVFTEIGYRSGDGNNMEPANWMVTLNLDMQEQFNSYSAAFDALWNKPWFYGFYWWIWESNPNAGGLDDTDFTPQNKPAEGLIESWYSSERHTEQIWNYQSLVVYGALSAAIITGVALFLTRKFSGKKQLKRLKSACLTQ